MLKLKCLVYSVYTSTVTGLHVLWSIQPLPGVNSEFLSNQDSNISKPSPLNLSWYAECQVLFLHFVFWGIYPTPTFILLLHASVLLHLSYSFIYSIYHCIYPVFHPTPTFILFLILLLHLSCFSFNSCIYPVPHPTPTFITLIILLLHSSCFDPTPAFPVLHPTPTFILFLILLLHLS